MFREWAESHPDVQLRVSVMPALEQHKAKLLLAAAAGRLPDIASVDSFWMPLFMAGGHVQPINDYWPEEDRADFLPFTIETLSDAGGSVYGVWHGTDCRVLYYRKDLVPVPPRTWAELLETASRISRERQIAGYLYNAGRWEAAVFDHLPPRRVRQVGHGPHPAERRGAPVDGHRGLGVGRLRPGSRSPEGGGGVPAGGGIAHQRGPHQPDDGAAPRPSERLPQLRLLPRQPLVRALRPDARPRTGPPGGADLSRAVGAAPARRRLHRFGRDSLPIRPSTGWSG